MFLKKGQIFQKGWTTSTPAVTDGWVFQKILLLKLAGDSLFSCFWQELGFSVKDNNGQIFLPAFYFYVQVLIVLVKETVTLVIHWFTLTVLESHVTDTSQSLIPGSDPPVTTKLFQSSALTQGCCVWCGGQSSVCAASRQVFLGFVLGFLERVQFWEIWFGFWTQALLWVNVFTCGCSQVGFGLKGKLCSYVAEHAESRILEPEAVFQNVCFNISII